MPQVTRNHVVSSGRTFALAAPPAAEIALMHASLNVFLAAELLDPFLLTEGYRAKVDTRRVCEVCWALHTWTSQRTQLCS